MKFKVVPFGIAGNFFLGFVSNFHDNFDLKVLLVKMNKRVLQTILDLAKIAGNVEPNGVICSLFTKAMYNEVAPYGSQVRTKPAVSNK